MAESAPLILVFEDLHWADDALLDFIDHFVEWSGGVALLVVCLARPELLERRPDWGGGKLNALTLALSPLADEDAARVIAAVLEQAVLPVETQRVLLERAGGNPLFAEQYARLFLERGSAEDLALPETVQGIIAARIDGLPVDEKAVLQDAAVFGKVFWAGALGDHPGLDALLHALERKEFVRRERRPSVAGENELAFRHVLVRDVAYSQIPRAARARKHERAADWIESLRREDHAELVAHHCLQALELARASGRDDSALAARSASAARRAGERARSLSAYAAAAGYFEQALGLTPADDPSRPHLLLSLGEARFVADLGDLTVLEEAAAAFLERGDREDAAEAERLLFRRDWFGGRTESSRAHLDRALELVADAPPSRTKADVLAQAARNATIGGAGEEALRLGNEALALAEQLGLDDIRAAVFTTIGLTRTNLGDWDGIEDLEQALELARATDMPSLEINIANNLAEVYHRSGDVTRARRLFEEVSHTADRFGVRSGSRWCKAHLLEFSFIAGAWDEAAAAADAFLRDSERAPHYLDPAVLSVRAQIFLARGDLATALEDSDSGLALAREAKDGQLLHPALFRRASVLFHAGQRREAGQLIDDLLVDGSGFWPDAQPEAPWLLGRLGRTIAGGELARGLRTPWIEAIEAGFAEDWLRAAEIYGALPHPTAEAFARLRAAETLLSVGRRAEAAGQLERALGFYRSVGALLYIREGESLLAATALTFEFLRAAAATELHHRAAASGPCGHAALEHRPCGDALRGQDRSGDPGASTGLADRHDGPVGRNLGAVDRQESVRDVADCPRCSRSRARRAPGRRSPPLPARAGGRARRGRRARSARARRRGRSPRARGSRPSEGRGSPGRRRRYSPPGRRSAPRDRAGNRLWSRTSRRQRAR